MNNCLKYSSLALILVFTVQGSTQAKDKELYLLRPALRKGQVVKVTESQTQVLDRWSKSGRKTTNSKRNSTWFSQAYRESLVAAGDKVEVERMFSGCAKKTQKRTFKPNKSVDKAVLTNLGFHKEGVKLKHSYGRWDWDTKAFKLDYDDRPMVFRSDRMMAVLLPKEPVAKGHRWNPDFRDSLGVVLGIPRADKALKGSVSAKFEALRKERKTEDMIGKLSFQLKGKLDNNKYEAKIKMTINLSQRVLLELSIDAEWNETKSESRSTSGTFRKAVKFSGTYEKGTLEMSYEAEIEKRAEDKAKFVVPGQKAKSSGSSSSGSSSSGKKGAGKNDSGSSGSSDSGRRSRKSNDEADPDREEQTGPITLKGAPRAKNDDEKALKEAFKKSSDKQRYAIHDYRGKARRYRGQDALRALKWCQQAFKAPSYKVRREALDCATWISDKGNEPLQKNKLSFIRKALKDDNAYVRHDAITRYASALGQDAFPKLERLVRDKHHVVRESLAQALRDRDEKRLHKDLVDKLVNDKDGRVVVWGFRALDKYVDGAQCRGLILKKLDKAPKDAGSSFRREMFAQLAKYPSPEVLERFLKEFKTVDNWEIRGIADALRCDAKVLTADPSKARKLVGLFLMEGGQGASTVLNAKLSVIADEGLIAELGKALSTGQKWAEKAKDQLRTIAKTKELKASAITALTAAAKSDKAQARAWALSELGWLIKDHSLFRDALSDSHKDARYSAIRALGRLPKDKATEAAVIKLLGTEENMLVLLGAIDYAEEKGVKDAVPALKALAAKTKSGSVKRDAQKAIKKLGG